MANDDDFIRELNDAETAYRRANDNDDECRWRIWERGLVHMYGLTETYGPHTVCEMPPDAEKMEAAERAAFLSRQGT